MINVELGRKLGIGVAAKLAGYRLFQARAAEMAFRRGTIFGFEVGPQFGHRRPLFCFAFELIWGAAFPTKVLDYFRYEV